MTDFEKQCAEAAEWMLRREVKSKDGYHFWKWTVLTNENTDSDSPEFSYSDAGLIFADFTVRGMLVPCLDDDGRDAYRINHGQKEHWDQIKSPRFHIAKIFGFKLADMILGGVIGAIIGAALMSMM